MGFPENLPAGWRAALASETQKPYFQELVRFLKEERARGKVIYPRTEWVLRALQELDLPEVRVVILGQDPYHGEGQAMGRSFAVPNTLKPKPPSLVNILKELAEDLGVRVPSEASDLSGWASQGVLLLNTVLTVQSGAPLSHRGKGWESFTDQIIRSLNARPEPLVFVLWGAQAQAKKAMLDLRRHRILESPHPSPLSAHRGFFGSKPFSRANEALLGWNQGPIDWAKIVDPSKN